MTTRITAVYARVSTEEQTRGLVASLDTQVEQCLSKAHDLALDVDPRLVIREQHSGADLRWLGTKFMSLVERAQRGEFTDLIVLDIDRFCRGGSDAYFEQKGHFTQAGVTVHYVLIDLRDMPFRNAVEAITADAAQWVRDKTREASVHNRTQWAASGNIVRASTPPFGFQFVYDETRRTRRNLPLVIGLMPDPVTGPALLHITQHIADRQSVGAAKAWCEANDIPTPRGAVVWSEATIRRILHNETNYGGRRSFITHREDRAGAAHRARDIKTKHRNAQVERSAQYAVDSSRIVAIPALTRDLWARALARLAENKQFASRHAALPEAERVAHALLFGGAVRCAVCHHGMHLHRERAGDGYAYTYSCEHRATSHEQEPSVTIRARVLDAVVWDVANAALHDEAFFASLIAAQQEVNGAAVRAASLRAQLRDLEDARDKLLAHLERLDADDELVSDYQAKLRKNKQAREANAASLAAAEKDAQQEDTRRANIAAFTDFARAQRDAHMNPTRVWEPIERRHILLALRTRCNVRPGVGVGRVHIHFDVRGLPGACDVFYAPTDDLTRDAHAHAPRWDTTPTFDLDLSKVPAATIDAGDTGDDDGSDGSGGSDAPRVIANTTRPHPSGVIAFSHSAPEPARWAQVIGCPPPSLLLLSPLCCRSRLGFRPPYAPQALAAPRLTR